MSHNHTLEVVVDKDWYQDDEVTQPYPHTFQPLVRQLLLEAAHLDIQQDQPYMPEYRTSLVDAIGYLRNNGKLGIQGGHLYYQEQEQTFSCSRVGGSIHYLNLGELRSLLHANYPNNGSVSNATPPV